VSFLFFQDTVRRIECFMQLAGKLRVISANLPDLGSLAM